MIQLLLLVHVLVGAALLGRADASGVHRGRRPSAPGGTFVRRFRASTRRRSPTSSASCTR